VRPIGISASLPARARPISALRVSISTAHLPQDSATDDMALHFALAQAALQTAAAALHCATQAPDNPQFCEHEKLVESQFVTHSFGA
jgi:hypothetical protein